MNGYYLYQKYMMKNHQGVKEFEKSLTKMNDYYMKMGFNVDELEKEWKFKRKLASTKLSVFTIILIIAFICQSSYPTSIIKYFLGVRCLFPNNYFIWEATRPIKDCSFCINMTEPIVLSNLSRQEFLPYAYSSKPIIIRKAFLHWPAINAFSLDYFKNLYNKTADSYRTVDEECQFLHFKSNFISIQDVFSMSKERSQNPQLDESWYVGWGNCHPDVLQEMRKFYPKPHFLPEDCEIPSKEYVFMGYDDGATMHLDFINRLMWQAQLKGIKTWHLVPPSECQSICLPFSFVAYPGDAVLVDTRVWYHATQIAPEQFSLSVQSEYG